MTWQVTHHAAVKSINTGRPALPKSATVVGVNARQGPVAAAETADGASTSPPRSSGETTTTDETSATAATPAHERRWPALKMRHAHSAIAIMTSATSSRTTASLSTCAPSTQTSHATVAYSGNASACFIRSIQAPGRGSQRRQAGNHASSV